MNTHTKYAAMILLLAAAAAQAVCWKLESEYCCQPIAPTSGNGCKQTLCDANNPSASIGGAVVDEQGDLLQTFTIVYDSYTPTVWTFPPNGAGGCDTTVPPTTTFGTPFQCGRLTDVVFCGS